MAMRMSSFVALSLFAASFGSSSAATTTQKTTSTKMTTTTTMTMAEYKFTGRITMVVPNVTTAQMEEAAQNSLASHFNVSTDRITVNATESRRLGSLRRLAGNWAIDYEFHAPAAKQAAISTKAQSASSDGATFKADFATAFKAALEAAGAPPNAVNNATVTAITVDEVIPAGMVTTAPAGSVGLSGASRAALSLVFMVIPGIKMML